MRSLLSVIAGIGAVLGLLLAATMPTGLIPNEDVFWLVRAALIMFTAMALVTGAVALAAARAREAQALRRISQSA